MVAWGWGWGGDGDNLGGGSCGGSSCCGDESACTGDDSACTGGGEGSFSVSDEGTLSAGTSSDISGGGGEG